MPYPVSMILAVIAMVLFIIALVPNFRTYPIEAVAGLLLAIAVLLLGH